MSAFNRLFLTPGALAFGVGVVGCGGIEPTGSEGYPLEAGNARVERQIAGDLLRPRVKTDLGPRGVLREPIGTEARIARELDQLRSLQVVEVGAAIRHAQVESCVAYGGCQVTDVDLSSVQVEERVASFVSAAIEVAGAFELPAEACSDGWTVDEEVLDANLIALRGLQIVEIGEMVRAEQTNDGSCYIGFCPSDAANCASANKVAAIARAVGAVD